MTDGIDLEKREKLITQESRASEVESENRRGGIQFPKNWPTTFKKQILKVKFIIFVL